MNKWTKIILEMETMWSESAEALLLIAAKADMETWRKERDAYKARRIYDLYGFDCFLKFVDENPHIREVVKVPAGCTRDGQCTFFCYYYGEGGCKNATK